MMAHREVDALQWIENLIARYIALKCKETERWLGFRNRQTYMVEAQ